MTYPSMTSSTPFLFAGAWALEPSRSSVVFRSTGLLGLPRVRGECTRISGEAFVDPTSGARGRIAIDARSIRTGRSAWDARIGSADMLASATFPEIVFTLRQFAFDGGDAHLSGTLRVRGVSEPLEFSADVRERDGTGLTLGTRFDLDCSRWGIDTTGPGKVKMTTTVEITARFTRRP